MVAEMIAQGLNNLSNLSGNKNNQSTKKSQKTKGKDSLAILVNGKAKTKKSFKKLLNENNKQTSKSDKVDFSKLFDILNLSKAELKEKISNMDKKELKDLEKMVQIALASILEKLNTEQKIQKLEELGISKKSLNELKSKLGFMQQLVNKQKNKLGIQTSDSDKTKTTNKSTHFQNNSKSTDSNSKTGLAMANNSTPKEATANVASNANNKTKVKQGPTVNLENKNTSNYEEKILSSMNIENKENMTKAEKVYYQTLKKQVSAENAKTEQVSIALKNKGKNSSAGLLNSELKANLDFKELNKNSDLQKLLNKENLNTGENKIKNATNNTKQDSSFSNLFSGNQQENNFAQLFGTQNFASSNNINSGNDGVQFNTAVLQGRELAKQITEQIKVLNKPSNNEIKLQLEPDFLGKVKMDLKVNGGKVTARFMVDNILVKNHLDQNISQLKSTLINQGFNVDNLEVNAEDSGYNMGKEDGSNQFFQDHNQKQNQRQLNYQEYEKLKDELLDLSPEQLEEIIENDPEKLRNWGYVQQNDWFNYGGHYQRMNLLA